MPLKPEEQAELVKFLNLEGEEDLEKAKEKFQNSYLPVEQHKSTIGKLTGTIATNVKKAFGQIGVQLTDDELKDRKIEEVIVSASEKAKSLLDEQKQEWEKRATASGSEEVIKEWEKKYKTVEKKLTEAEQARLDAINSFDQFKVQVETEKKQGKIEHVFNSALNSIKFDPSVNEFTKKGFIATINEKYVIDLEDDGNAVVKDKKTGDRIKSSAKAGTFLGVEDILLTEATQAGIIQKNPAAGRPVSKPGQNGYVPPIETQNKPQSKVNPRFFGV